jgi:hypothetical protein
VRCLGGASIAHRHLSKVPARVWAFLARACGLNRPSARLGSLRNCSEPYLLTFVITVQSRRVFRLPYGGALTSDALKQ